MRKPQITLTYRIDFPIIFALIATVLNGAITYLCLVMKTGVEASVVLFKLVNITLWLLPVFFVSQVIFLPLFSSPVLRNTLALYLVIFHLSIGLNNVQLLLWGHVVLLGDFPVQTWENICLIVSAIVFIYLTVKSRLHKEAGYLLIRESIVYGVIIGVMFLGFRSLPVVLPILQCRCLIQQPLAPPTPARIPATASVITAANVQQLEELACFDFCDLETPLPDMKGNVFKVAWRPDGQEFVVVPWGHHKMFFFDVHTLTEIKQLSVRCDGSEVEVSPNNTIIAVAALRRPMQGNVCLLNAQDGSLITMLEAGNDQPDLAFSPNGQVVATGGYGRAVGLWQVANGRLLRAWNLEEHTEGGLRVAFSPNGKLLATSNRNGQTRLWDACRGKLLHILDKVMVHDVKFHPDGTLLAVAYVNGAVGLWNVADGELITLVDGHAPEVYSLTWSPKGDILAWCGTNGTIVFWSAVSKTVLRTLDAAPHVRDLKFSPDGRFLLSGGSAVRIWGIPK